MGPRPAASLGMGCAKVLEATATRTKQTMRTKITTLWHDAKAKSLFSLLATADPRPSELPKPFVKPSAMVNTFASDWKPCGPPSCPRQTRSSMLAQAGSNTSSILSHHPAVNHIKAACIAAFPTS